MWRKYSGGEFTKVATTSNTYYSETLYKGGNYWYYVIAVDTKDVWSEPSNTVLVEVPGDGIPKKKADTLAVTVLKPETFALSQNYPNPFNPETEIKYQLPVESYVVLKIFNLLGQEVRTLVEGKKGAGYYTALWDAKDNSGNDVASGVYIYRMVVGDYIEIRKMILIR